MTLDELTLILAHLGEESTCPSPTPDASFAGDEKVKMQALERKPIKRKEGKEKEIAGLQMRLEYEREEARRRKS